MRSIETTHRDLTRRGVLGLFGGGILSFFGCREGEQATNPALSLIRLLEETFRHYYYDTEFIVRYPFEAEKGNQFQRLNWDSISQQGCITQACYCLLASGHRIDTVIERQNLSVQSTGVLATLLHLRRSASIECQKTLSKSEALCIRNELEKLRPGHAKMGMLLDLILLDRDNISTFERDAISSINKLSRKQAIATVDSFLEISQECGLDSATSLQWIPESIKSARFLASVKIADLIFGKEINVAAEEMMRHSHTVSIPTVARLLAANIVDPPEALILWTRCKEILFSLPAPYSYGFNILTSVADIRDKRITRSLEDLLSDMLSKSSQAESVADSFLLASEKATAHKNEGLLEIYEEFLKLFLSVEDAFSRENRLNVALSSCFSEQSMLEKCIRKPTAQELRLVGDARQALSDCFNDSVDTLSDGLAKSFAVRMTTLPNGQISKERRIQTADKMPQTVHGKLVRGFAKSHYSCNQYCNRSGSVQT